VLGLGMALVGNDEAFAGRGIRRMPNAKRLMPPVRDGRREDKSTDVDFLAYADDLAYPEKTLSQEDELALMKVWRVIIDKSRATLGEDGFRAALQQREIKLDEFLLAEPRTDFVSLARINYDALHRAWPRTIDVTRHWERMENQDNAAAKPMPRQEAPIDVLINTVLLVGFAVFVVNLIRVNSRRLFPSIRNA